MESVNMLPEIRLPEISCASIVLVGKFNMLEFLPKYLIENNVIQIKDLKDMDWNTYIPSQRLDFEFLWGQVIVTPTQLIVKAKATPYISTSDFIRSALLCASDEVKVFAMGINLEGDFKLEYSYQRDNIGTKLVPPSAWGKWGEEVDMQLKKFPDPKKHGGMVSATMRKHRVDEKGLYGFTDVHVKPSAVYLETGVYLSINDHYQMDEKIVTASELAQGDFTDRKNELMQLLDQNFDTSIASSRRIMGGILEKV